MAETTIKPTWLDNLFSQTLLQWQKAEVRAAVNSDLFPEANTVQHCQHAVMRGEASDYKPPIPGCFTDLHSPAQVRGEHVESFILFNDRMERCSVGSVDHVALVGGPPVQRAVGMHNFTNVHLSFTSMRHKCCHLHRFQCKKNWNILNHFHWRVLFFFRSIKIFIKEQMRYLG